MEGTEKAKRQEQKDIEVRFVELEPMCVACSHVISDNPERDAWQKLYAWAEPKGLLEDTEKNPVFGFNNPSPTPGFKEYGYEFWIGVDSDARAEGDIEIKKFPGGLYAAASCNSLAAIGPTWIKLWNYVNSDKCKHKWRHTHELEKLLNPGASEKEFVFDLYLPIE